MKLSQKILLLFGITCLAILAVVGGFVNARLERIKFASIADNFEGQLTHIDFALTGFFSNVEADLIALALDDRVRTPDDEGFTRFTQADPETFEYHIGPHEKAIIDIFNRYRITHPFVNSVYMGRENGSFVRSHQRTRATPYDPRTRPWYQLSTSQPGKVVRTSPYPSVTTADINIGMATALADGDGTVYGVVGIDITLNNLTDYINNIQIGRKGWAALVDEYGTILVARDPTLRFQNIAAIDAAVASAIQTRTKGVSSFVKNSEKHYFFFNTSKELGWKIAFVFPAEDIDREVQGLVIRVCLALLVALALLSGLTLMGLRRFVVKPLEQLNRGAEYIAESGDLSHHIDIRSRDELGGLARSFNQMMEAIRQSEAALRASEAALKQHRDHLEERVEERTEALLNSQQQMAQIIDFLPDPTFVVDNDGIVLAWNKAMEQLCGISAEEMVGRGNHEYALPFYGKRRPVLIDMVRRWEADLEGAYETLQREGKVLVSESFHPHMGDGGVYLSGTAGLLYDDEGRVAGAIESLRDISRRKQIEKELIEAKTAADEANRAKSDFLANMSHEIRTPMNAVIGMTHLALKTDLSKKQLDYLTKIRTSAEALLGIINDILDFSKIEAGKLDMESVPFNLDEVFANLADLVTVKAREKDRLEVLFHIAPDVPRSLKGDPLRLGQVLVNLAGNAVKFTDIGEIVVSAEHIGQASDRCTLRFSVKDTGIGMSREQMERLFESFTQADTSTTRKYGGTGLGLTICKRLVEMMDGSISVDSQPGGGSTFSFTAVFGIGPKTEASAHLPPPDLRGLKVLVVDDNPTSREILSTMLTAFGFETVPAPSAEEGLAELEGTAGSRPFDLVIMDWRMPGMDGIEAGRRIKNHSSLSKIPAVILITAYGRQEIIKQVEKAGFDGFLLKPVSPSVLFDAVMQAFGRITDDAARRLDPSADDGPAAPRLDGSRLLVVEDNDINRQVAQEILAGAGAVVALAENGEEALDVLARERFDAVLMDVQMPVMDGYTATRKIRQDMGLTDLPVIAMTAHAMAGDREKSLDAGMNAHINKPIDPDELVSVLRQWIPMAAPAGTGPGDPPSPSRGEAPILPDHLAGFEIDEGLKRLQGNRDLYRKLLIRFADGYAEAPDHIRTAIDGAKFDDAQRLAHTLKGVAGNLSAPDLQKTAADLEKVLKHREDLDRLPTLMGAFESALNLAVASVRATLASPAPPPSPEAGDPPPPVPIELAKKTAERLREAAEIGDVGEITAIVDAVAADHPAFTALRETIMVLVEDFDFEGILKTAEELSSP